MDETQFEEKRERRSGKDRRARPTSPFTIQSLRGSRQHFRRKEDTRKLFFVDLYSPLSVAVLIFTVGLSVVDAFLTLELVGQNARRVEPGYGFFP